MNSTHRRLRQALEAHGLLLESDAHLPSLASLVTGAPVRGSWWAHPQGGLIFDLSNWLTAQSDVLVCKLVSGKVTYVHRTLWPAVFAVGSAREPWQMQRLSGAALALFESVRRVGELRTDDISWTRGAGQPPAAEAARELEQRLLVHAEQVHTARGFHAKRLESWEHWAQRVGFNPRRRSAARARRQLERVLNDLNRRFAARAHLPWSER